MTIAYIINRDAKKPFLCKQEGTKGGPIGRARSPGRALSLFLAKLTIPADSVSIGKVQYL